MTCIQKLIYFYLRIDFLKAKVKLSLCFYQVPSHEDVSRA